MHSSVLPKFILYNQHIQEYICCNLSRSVKSYLLDQLNQTYLTDHPELESTRYNPEIDWKASIWPINDKSLHEYQKLENFQYKLKTNSLLTPAERFHSNIASPNIPIPDNPMCPICKQTEHEATTDHIFGQCTVAKEQNAKTWDKIIQKLPDLNETGPWFSYYGNQLNKKFKTGYWETVHRNKVYIPKKVLAKLNKESKITIQKIIAKTRYKIWTKYWEQYIQMLPKNDQLDQTTAENEKITTVEAENMQPKQKQSTILNFFHKLAK
jgi:hypothetical protein